MRYGLWRQTIPDVSYAVMPGLVPGIHVALSVLNDVDGRDKPGHDDVATHERTTLIARYHGSAPSRGARIASNAIRISGSPPCQRGEGEHCRCGMSSAHTSKQERWSYNR